MSNSTMSITSETQVQDGLKALSSRPSCGKSTRCEACKAKAERIKAGSNKARHSDTEPEKDRVVMNHHKPNAPMRKVGCWHGLFKGTPDF